MNITVESTTDSAKDVLAANAGKSAVVETEVETPEVETAEVETEEPADAGETAEQIAEKAEKKKPGGYQKKIAKLEAALSEKDKELETLRKPATPEVKTVEKTVTPSKEKPKVEDFDTHAEYVEALTDWKIEAKEVERESKRAEELAKQKQAEALTERQKSAKVFNDKIEAFKKDAPDFQEAIDDVDDLILSPLAHEAIFTSDLGPQMMYELAKNREELERIHKLPPLAQVRELGKVEARLTKSEETTVKKTNAPPPIAPVGSKGSSKTTKSPDEMTQEEYRAWRLKKK